MIINIRASDVAACVGMNPYRSVEEMLSVYIGKCKGDKLDHSFDIVQMLVKAGVNVNKSDIFKQSPLMYSICEFRHDIMRLLLKNGADKYFQTELGNTPLMIAVNVNNIEAVKILIEYGVDDLLENTYCNNARDCAVIDSDIYNLLINTFGAQNRESTDEEDEDIILFEPFFF